MLTNPVQGARKLYEASEALLGAENFKEVMRVGLLLSLPVILLTSLAASLFC